MSHEENRVVTPQPDGRLKVEATSHEGKRLTWIQDREERPRDADGHFVKATRTPFTVAEVAASEAETEADFVELAKLRAEYRELAGNVTDPDRNSKMDEVKRQHDLLWELLGIMDADGDENT